MTLQIKEQSRKVYNLGTKACAGCHQRRTAYIRDLPDLTAFELRSVRGTRNVGYCATCWNDRYGTNIRKELAKQEQAS